MWKQKLWVKGNWGKGQIGTPLPRSCGLPTYFFALSEGMDALQGFCPSTPNCKWKGWVGLMGSLRHIKCLPETRTGKLFQSDLHNEKPPDSLITSLGSLIYWSFVHVPLANIESEVFRRNPNALIALPRKAAISWWRISMRAKLPGTRWDMVRGQNRIEWNLTEGLKGLPSLKPNIAPENGWLEY